ncbi:hypothetical protein K458DRAFT_406916 [Lentithecium fluviatile CBS 122367]|uniref:Uncharacterized protein n=1 Tax=Lentithecium fluviatile CBS 122367 TaxID=1168545 RepID=A0A6G1IRZ8_9PLEO|nr:hypothetical protein K458DRAFT_406916 [Lentithecium fluviatile CBS 122367]
MTDFLASIAKNGLRATVRILCYKGNTLVKRPSKQRPQYARIRRQTKNGRKSRPAVYELTSEAEGERGKAKTYRRVDGGEPLDDGEVEEYVTAKKSVVQDKRQRLRVKGKEKDNDKGSSHRREESSVELSQDDGCTGREHHTASKPHHHHLPASGQSSYGTRNRSQPIHARTAKTASAETRTKSKSTRSHYTRPRKHGYRGTYQPPREAHATSSPNKASSARQPQAYQPQELSIIAQTSQSKQTHHGSSRTDVSTNLAASTIRQVHFTAPHPANETPHAIPADTPGSPSSFKQPAMDEQSSQSFIFGPQGTALTHSPGAIPRSDGTAPPPIPTIDAQLEYVRGADGNVYAVDPRYDNLQAIEEEGGIGSVETTVAAGETNTPL